MEVCYIEASNSSGGGVNWGKFMLMRPTREDWLIKSIFNQSGLLTDQGWTERHIWVLDLATGEGAFFKHAGHAVCDLRKHQIWVCPLFEPFLEWLYEQDVSDFSALPKVVDLPKAVSSLFSYRREGPSIRHDS